MRDEFVVNSGSRTNAVERTRKREYLEESQPLLLTLVLLASLAIGWMPVAKLITYCVRSSSITEGGHGVCIRGASRLFRFLRNLAEDSMLLGEIPRTQWQKVPARKRVPVIQPLSISNGDDTSRCGSGPDGSRRSKVMRNHRTGIIHGLSLSPLFYACDSNWCWMQVVSRFGNL